MTGARSYIRQRDGKGVSGGVQSSMFLEMGRDDEGGSSYHDKGGGDEDYRYRDTRESQYLEVIVKL